MVNFPDLIQQNSPFQFHSAQLVNIARLPQLVQTKCASRLTTNRSEILRRLNQRKPTPNGQPAQVIRACTPSCSGGVWQAPNPEAHSEAAETVCPARSKWCSNVATKTSEVFVLRATCGTVYPSCSS